MGWETSVSITSSFHVRLELCLNALCVARIMQKLEFGRQAVSDMFATDALKRLPNFTGGAIDRGEMTST